MTTLRLLTMGPSAPAACEDTYDCPCQPCVQDREQRAANAPLRHPEQPWTPRPARRAA